MLAYAQSWLLVHYLMSTAEALQRFRQYLKRLLPGSSPTEESRTRRLTWEISIRSTRTCAAMPSAFNSRCDRSDCKKSLSRT